MTQLGRDGRPLFINFWATWCSPCRAEMPGLDRLYRNLSPRGLEVVGVAIDEDLNLVREFLLRYRISFPVLHDHGGEVTRTVLKIQAYPTSVLVRPDGLVSEVVVGERAWDALPAQHAVSDLLSG